MKMYIVQNSISFNNLLIEQEWMDGYVCIYNEVRSIPSKMVSLTHMRICLTEYIYGYVFRFYMDARFFKDSI